MLNGFDFFFPSLCSGYDFGYFVKLLTAESLPTTEETFFDRLRTWFPTIYDIKFMMRSCKSLKGGLQEVADDLGVRLSISLFFHPTPSTCRQLKIYMTCITGRTNRSTSSSRLRFPLNRIYLFQNA